MSRNTANSQWNKTFHDEDTDGEASLRAQHAALTKMAAPPEPVTTPDPVPPLVPVTHQAAPESTPTVPVAPHPFHNLIAMVKRPKAYNAGLRVAKVPGVK